MDSFQQLTDDYMDANGEVPPPWAIYPDLERYTIEWRMGCGEEAMDAFHSFLDILDTSLEVRLALLRRHPPAPYTWADWIDGVLMNPDRRIEAWDPDDPEVRKRLDWQREQKLIASDIAYPTWVTNQQGRQRLPWEASSPTESPATAARYNTREFAFISRQLKEHPLPAAPPGWQLTGPVPTSQGLLYLAQQLLSGMVTPPWEFGLETETFKDTFDDDMGYADAFRLWTDAAFDDAEHFQHYLNSVGTPPDPWSRWLEANAIPRF